MFLFHSRAYFVRVSLFYSHPSSALVGVNKRRYVSANLELQFKFLHQNN